MEAGAFEDFMYANIAKWLREIPKGRVEDVYVIRFSLGFHPAPEVDVGVNTESRATDLTPTAERPGGSLGSQYDEDRVAYTPYEARWDPVYWDPATGVSVPDPYDERSRQIRDRWCAEFSEDDDLPAAFDELVVRVSRRLHEEGVIANCFGRSVPIALVSDEERILDLSWEGANPPEAITILDQAAEGDPDRE